MMTIVFHSYIENTKNENLSLKWKACVDFQDKSHLFGIPCGKKTVSQAIFWSLFDHVCFFQSLLLQEIPTSSSDLLAFEFGFQDAMWV